MSYESDDDPESKSDDDEGRRPSLRGYRRAQDQMEGIVQDITAMGLDLHDEIVSNADWTDTISPLGVQRVWPDAAYVPTTPDLIRDLTEEERGFSETLRRQFFQAWLSELLDLAYADHHSMARQPIYNPRLSEEHNELVWSLYLKRVIREALATGFQHYSVAWRELMLRDYYRWRGDPPRYFFEDVYSGFNLDGLTEQQHYVRRRLFRDGRRITNMQRTCSVVEVRYVAALMTDTGMYNFRFRSFEDNPEFTVVHPRRRRMAEEPPNNLDYMAWNTDDESDTQSANDNPPATPPGQPHPFEQQNQQGQGNPLGTPAAQGH